MVTSFDSMRQTKTKTILGKKRHNRVATGQEMVREKSGNFILSQKKFDII